MDQSFRDSLCTDPAANRITTGGGRCCAPPPRPGLRCGGAIALGVGVLLATLGTTAGAQAPELRLSDAWVRAMPPGQRMTAAYLHIENAGSAAAVVDGVEASAGSASLHETARAEGRVRMQAVARLEIPAGAAVTLAPGGLHVMLTGLARTPAEGEAVTLCLTGSAPRTCVDAPVLRSAPDALDHGGG